MISRPARPCVQQQVSVCAALRDDGQARRGPSAGRNLTRGAKTGPFRMSGARRGASPRRDGSRRRGQVRQAATIGTRVFESIVKLCPEQGSHRTRSHVPRLGR
jgi:hypothetical protein